jgi:hypothetical protein
MGLTVIYNGKPRLRSDIVLPDRGKKGVSKSPLIITNDEARHVCPVPMPNATTKCSIVMYYIFLQKPSAALKAGPYPERALPHCPR